MSPEAKRFRCPSCGAPADPEALQCEYCRSQLSTVACPRCFAAVAPSANFCNACGATLLVPQQGEGESLPCPGCKGTLFPRALGQTPAHPCETCGGLWLEAKALDTLVASGARREALLAGLPEEEPPREATVSYRTCPVCRKHMNRVNYAKVSRVIVDVCRDHGTWFDRDELRRLLQFIDGGGLDKARQKEIQELQLERARLQAQVSGGAHLGPEPLGGNDSSLLFNALFKFLS